MSWNDNRWWDARTRFSDDPFVSGDVPPFIRDDLKTGYLRKEAKIYRSNEEVGPNQACAVAN